MNDYIFNSHATDTKAQAVQKKHCQVYSSRQHPKTQAITKIIDQ